MQTIQARILEWVAMPSSRESSWTRDRSHVSCNGKQIATEPPGNYIQVLIPRVWSVYFIWKESSQVQFKLRVLRQGDYFELYHSYPYKRQSRERSDMPLVKMKAESGYRWRSQQPPEARRGKGQILLSSIWSGGGPASTLISVQWNRFWTPALQKCEKLNFYHFQQWNLW